MSLNVLPIKSPLESTFYLVDTKLDMPALLALSQASRRFSELVRRAPSWKNRCVLKFSDLFPEMNRFSEECFYRLYRNEVVRRNNLIHLDKTVKRVEKLTLITFTLQVTTAWHLVPIRYRPFNLLGEGISYLLKVTEAKGLARRENFDAFIIRCQEYWPNMTEIDIKNWYISLKNAPIRPA